MAVLIGIANPMPTEPLPPPVAIWELMPITRPSPSISGPPLFPGLIEASVWITLEIEKPLGARISRATADTIPVVTVRVKPNGLPIATTGSPTCAELESPSGTGRALLILSGSTLSTARSVDGSRPLTVALTGSPSSSKLTVTSLGPSTTWRVGHDRAVVVHQEARAGGGALLLLRKAEERGLLLHPARGDERHAATLFAVDLGDCLARRSRWLDAGCATGVWRTTVFVSPASMTSVARSTVPTSSTSRPPMAPARSVREASHVPLPCRSRNLRVV